MIEFSAFADEVSPNFERQVEFLASQKIPAMEIRFVNGKNIMDLNELELRETKKMLSEKGIKVSAIGSPIGKVKLDEPFSKHFEKFKHAVELADYFNTDFIRVFSYYASEGENIDNFREEVIERMVKKVEFLRDTKIVMVHENEAGIYGHSASNCLDLVETVNSDSLKLAYDPANFVWGEGIADNVDRCWPLMKDHVIHVHIKDWSVGSKDIGSMPGDGDGQIKELLYELAKDDYKGYLTMEPHLKIGGQFGGETGPELFAQAVSTTKDLCKEVGLKF